MIGRNVPKSLNYGDLLEGWEFAIAKALVAEFCGYKKTFPRDEFDDLLQKVVVHWVFQRDTYDPTGTASQRTFMRRVVRNKLIDLTREKKAQKRRMLDTATSLESPPGEDEKSPSPAETRVAADLRSAARIKLKAYLSRALKKLTARQKTILELKADGLANTEIAEQVGVSRDTVQIDIRRIRELFEDEGLREYL